MRFFNKIYHGIIFVIIVCIYYCSFPLAFILYGKKKYWLISEVDFDARDNGLHFFIYLNKEHREINSLFLISKKNPLYSFVKSVGKTIEPHSYKHYLVFIASKAKISTLVHGCSPSWCITKILLKHHSTGKNIALKHGIFKNLHANYFKKNAHLDMICCGAEPEFRFIDKEFGYSEGVAQYTGLARFDNLHNLDIKKEIFIMPTWRRWLDSINDIGEFKGTKYFNSWFSFLNDNKFLDFCSETGLKIYFYVHPKLNKFLEAMKCDRKEIIFLNSKNGDSIQKHLRDAAILITDFSSVFFDFAYMRKPTIYFQFDEKDYYSQHYQIAYFDYRKDGFGPVVLDKESILDELNTLSDNNLKISKYYLERVNAFFPLYDTNNCKRIFERISLILL